MIPFKDLRNILFLDIETVSATSSYQELESSMKTIWDKKAQYIDSGLQKETLYFDKAAIYAEFGKIITIAVGLFFQDESGELCLKVKSFSSDSEKILLNDFKNLIEEKYKPDELVLCAHNGKEFDYPYICRRMLVNGILIPEALNMTGKKPWEVKHLDTLEMWKFGDRKNYTSLELLANIFGVPAEKSQFNGSHVNEAYYVHKDLRKIAEYCQNDVILTAQVFLRMHTESVIPKENIYIT